VPDNVWALDVRTGHLIWHYTYKQNQGLHIGHRGVAVYKDNVYFMTPDAHVICLDAKNGKPRWDVVVADVTKGYWTSMSPLIIHNHMIVGVSGDFDNLTGYLRALDPDGANTMAVGCDTATGHTQYDDGWEYVDDGNLRSRLEFDLLGHGQPHAGSEWQSAARR